VSAGSERAGQITIIDGYGGPPARGDAAKCKTDMQIELYFCCAGRTNRLWSAQIAKKERMNERAAVAA
jgi:hypothetical protein